MITAIDEQYLRRTIQVAMSARGRVEPNPMVGCVIVKEGRIIGEGCHGQFGGPHAEPTALAACTESPAGATAYVTLEPCCHLNKKTPPCAPRLIEAKIARVVIGCLDPNPDVNGKGVSMLQRAGITIERAPETLSLEFQQLISPFVLSQTIKRPYITLKWAQSANGKVAGEGGARVQISGPISQRLTHELRTRSHAIAVGVNTILSDDPQLNVRDVAMINTPARIIFDRLLRTPPTAKILQSEKNVHILCSQHAHRDHPNRVRALRDKGALIEALQLHDDEPAHYQTSQTLAALSGMHLMIEPGPTLAKAFLPLADRLWVFKAPHKLPAGPKAAVIPEDYVETGRTRSGDDELIEYLNRASPSFKAAVPSADFLLAQNSSPFPEGEGERRSVSGQ